MTELADLVEAYKREVAIPGAFSVAFPLTSDEDITAALADAFAEATLDGFFSQLELDLDTMTITPDLSTAGAALIVLYAGLRLVRQQIRGIRARVRYKAGPVEMEEAQASSALTEDLRYLTQRRRELLENARRGRGVTTFVIDSYNTRGAANNMYGGFYNSEVANPHWEGIFD